MNRRDSLKIFGIGAIGTGLLLEGCKLDQEKPPKLVSPQKVSGRQEFEIERLKRIRNNQFFTEHELLTITVLADIIIPKDEISGSASDAKVTDFIEFIVKDIPEHQVPMRGGLKWLDVQCLNRYNNSFKACTQAQQLEMVKEIAYPFKAKPEMQQGVVFFNRMRNLTATGFYTSKMGIEDIGYVGNRPNKWEGVPADVLAKHNLQGVII